MIDIDRATNMNEPSRLSVPKRGNDMRSPVGCDGIKQIEVPSQSEQTMSLIQIRQVLLSNRRFCLNLLLTTASSKFGYFTRHLMYLLFPRNFQIMIPHTIAVEIVPRVVV
jgi:hypothetical protein